MTKLYYKHEKLKYCPVNASVTKNMNLFTKYNISQQ